MQCMSATPRRLGNGAERRCSLTMHVQPVLGPGQEDTRTRSSSLRPLRRHILVHCISSFGCLINNSICISGGCIFNTSCHYNKTKNIRSCAVLLTPFRSWNLFRLGHIEIFCHLHHQTAPCLPLCKTSIAHLPLPQDWIGLRPGERRYVHISCGEPSIESSHSP